VLSSTGTKRSSRRSTMSSSFRYVHDSTSRPAPIRHAFELSRTGHGTREDKHQANLCTAKSEQLFRIRSGPFALRPHRRCPRRQACQRLPLGCPGIRRYVLFHRHRNLGEYTYVHLLGDGALSRLSSLASRPLRRVPLLTHIRHQVQGREQGPVHGISPGA
jgi:hypothetical protein